MGDQYEVVNPPNAGDAPSPPPIAPNPPPPAPPGAGPGETGSTLLETKTNLKSDVKTPADPSAMPEAPDFGGGQSTYTNPVPPADSKSQKDNVITEKPGKKRSILWMAIFGGLAALFLIIAVVGGLGAASMFG